MILWVMPIKLKQGMNQLYPSMGQWLALSSYSKTVTASNTQAFLGGVCMFFSSVSFLPHKKKKKHGCECEWPVSVCLLCLYVWLVTCPVCNPALSHSKLWLAPASCNPAQWHRRWMDGWTTKRKFSLEEKKTTLNRKRKKRSGWSWKLLQRCFYTK